MAPVRANNHNIFSLISARVRKLQALGLDMLYPPCCFICNCALENADGLCGACWSELRFISKPFCPRLGIPFAADMGETIISAEAIAFPPPYHRARAAVVYDELARRLVSQFKYSDRLELAKLLARLMVQAGAEYWDENCVLLPVPLHWRRRLSRRYNQSQLLADEISRLTGMRPAKGWIKRVKSTRQQVGLSSQERENNVRGAFGLTAEFLEQYQGEAIVIIDDVVTTGATVEAIARCFKSKNRTKINVLSFARVVSDPIGTI